MSVDNAVQIIADAFYTILTEASLHQVAPILASISTVLADNSDKYDVTDMINKHVGQAEDQQTRQLLADLRTHFEQRIYKDEITRLQECFAQDRDAGWNTWLNTFAKVISDWRVPFLPQMVSETFFSFPEQHTEEIERIKQWVRYYMIERFEECHGMMLYFAQQTVLPNTQRAKLFVLAAEIQIYRFFRFTEGKRLLEEAETQDPQAYTVLCGWAVYWLQQKEYKKAQDLLQEAISLQPQSAGAYKEMGDFYDAQDDFDAAEEWYHEAIRRDAGDPDTYISMIRLYGRNEELFKLHEADLPLLRERASSVSPFATYRAYLITALAYQTNKRYDETYFWYKQAIALDKTRVDAYVQMSYAYGEEQKYQEAYDVLQDALSVAPDIFDGYWAMAILYEQQKHWADAVDWYRQALPYRPEWKGTIYRKIGEMLWHLQEYTPAIEELFKALNTETEEQEMQSIINTLEAYAEEFYGTRAKPEEAREIYQEIYRVRGTSYAASYYNRLGNLVYYSKNYQEAATYYRQAMAADSKDPDYPSNLAYALEHLINASSEGIQALNDTYEALQDALKLSPKNNDYIQRRARIELKQQQLKKSGAFVLELSPTPFSIKIELGATLVQPFLSIEGIPPEVQTLVDALRKRFLEYYGIWVPNINFSDSLNLSKGNYAFKISGLPLIEGEVPVGKRFFPGSSLALTELAIQVPEEASDPLIGIQGYWLASEDWQKVEAADLPLYQEMEYPLRHLEAVLPGINATLIDHLRTAALLVKETTEAQKQIATTPTRLLGFVQILRTLASEHIAFASAVDPLAQAFLAHDETETDFTSIIEQIRQLPMLQSNLPGNNAQYAFYRLEPYFEQEIAQSLMKIGTSSVLVMRATRYTDFINSVTRHIGIHQKSALLVKDIHIRPFARTLLDPQFPQMPVLALDDLAEELRERPMTEIEVPRTKQDHSISQDGSVLALDNLLKDFTVQHNGLETNGTQNGSSDEKPLEIKVFLHPSWYSLNIVQGNTTDAEQPETQITQKIDEKLLHLQQEIFREQGIILPIIHLEKDEKLPIYEIRLHAGTEQELHEIIPKEEWEAQTPEEFITEVGILQIVEDIFSIIPAWCREIGGSLLTTNDVQFHLQLLKEGYYDALVENALQQFGLPFLTQILKEILHAGESISELRTILEVLVAIAATLPIDDRYLPVYSGITTQEMLKDAKTLLFLPRAMHYYPTYTGKSLQQLNATDYAHYVQMFLQQAPFHKEPTTPSDHIRASALNPAQRLAEKIAEALHLRRENLLIQRGIAHEERKEYSQALTAYNQAIMLNPTKAGSYNLRGNIHYACNEYQEALTDYTHAIALSSANPVFYFNRAMAHEELKEYQAAVADYTQTLALKPTDTDYYNRRGNLYYDHSQYQEALADYTQAISLDPHNPVFYYNRAITYDELNAYQEALANYTQAIALNSTDTGYYNRRGNLYYVHNAYPEALADYTQAVTLDPANPVFYFNRAAAYEELKEYSQALIDYNQAITLNPANANYYHRRGGLHYLLKAYSEALADCTRAIELAPTSVNFYSNRAAIYEELHAYPEAFADYTQAITLNPTAAGYYNLRGNLYYTCNEYPEALADYTQAITLNPTNPVFHFNRATAYEELKAYPEALANYTQAISLNSTDTDYYNRRGNIYYACEQYSEAIADYNQAVALNPNNPVFYYNRATAYEELNTYQEALADYTQAIALNPNNTDYYNRRGNLYYTRNEYTEALTDYTQAIALNPNNPVFYNNRAATYELLKAYQEAIDDYTQAIALNPKNIDYYNSRMQLYFNLKEYDKVLVDYAEMIALSPSDPNLFNSRAYISFLLTEYKQALVDIEQAIALAPADATFYFSQAVLYEQLREDDKALASYTEAIKLDQTKANYYYRREQLYFTLNNYEEALHDLEQALALDPANEDFQRERELIYAKKDELERNSLKE